jgi:hypothetical protein
MVCKKPLGLGRLIRVHGTKKLMNYQRDKIRTIVFRVIVMA